MADHPLEVRSNRVLFCHLNAQSLRNKIDEVKSSLSKSVRPIILGINESWLDSTVSDQEVSMQNYNTFRRDRRSGRGGGILVFIRDIIKSKRRIDLEKDNIECLWTELKLNKKSLLLGNIYRPPNATTAFFNDLEAMLEKVATQSKGVVLVGDLNINLLTKSGLAERMDLTASENSLIQLVSTPTRITNQTTLCHYWMFFIPPNLISSSIQVQLTSPIVTIS